MGLRAVAVAGSVVGAEGSTLFDSVEPISAIHVGAMLALMIVAFLALRPLRRYLLVIWSLVLISQPIPAGAMDLDAVNFVVVSTVAVLGGSGWMYGAGKTIQVGREMIDASAEIAESTIATGKQMTEAIVEDSAWGLSMTVRAILLMLALAAVSCAGRIVFRGSIQLAVRSCFFRISCLLIGLLYFFLPSFVYLRLPCRKRAKASECGAAAFPVKRPRASSPAVPEAAVVRRDIPPMPLARCSMPANGNQRGRALIRSRSVPSRGSEPLRPPPPALRDVGPSSGIWWQRRIGQEVRCRYKQGSRQDRFRVVIPVKCGRDKMMIYDPEIAATACYQYSLIEVEQEGPPPTEPFEEGILDSTLVSEDEEVILDDQDSGAEDPRVVDANEAGGASQLALQDPHQLSSSDAAWVNARVAEGLSQGRINHAPYFMAMMPKSAEQTHAQVAPKAFARAMQQDRVRLEKRIRPWCMLCPGKDQGKGVIRTPYSLVIWLTDTLPQRQPLLQPPSWDS